MCAIFGVLSSRRVKDSYTRKFKKAFSLTKHRGPTESNVLFLENALLGFHRLSIVGKDNGLQPIFNEDKSLLLVCNGEIYNYQELKNKLRDQHIFKTDSDCEVILHLYEENPHDFASLLRGQFAFLIYDLGKNKLLFARDRFGINPLFYANNQNSWIISSEIKSILAIDKQICNRLDTLGLMETYFLYGPTPPRTCFENIFQVKPGHVCIIDMQKNEVVSEKRFWRLPKLKKRTNAAIHSELKRLLTNSVNIRSQSDDSRIATYLSGGIDSASITSLMNTNKTTESFSVQFRSSQFDESFYQKLVAEHLSINLHSVKGDNLLDDFLSQVVWHNEHPLIRTAPLPLFILSKKVRKHDYKFVCCGEGADELMLGYPVLNDNVSSIESKFYELKSVKDLFNSPKIDSELINSSRKNIAKEFNTPIDSLRTTQLVEIYTKLSRFLLVQQGDRMSMSHGVEQRFPFLDEDLFDFIFSLPEQQFKYLYKDKKALREVVNELLPGSIVDRPKKGYLAPMDDELYVSQVVEKKLKDILTNKRHNLELYFNIRNIKKLAEKYETQSLSKPESIAVLIIVSTDILHNQHFA